MHWQNSFHRRLLCLILRFHLDHDIRHLTQIADCLGKVCRRSRNIQQNIAVCAVADRAGRCAKDARKNAAVHGHFRNQRLFGRHSTVEYDTNLLSAFGYQAVSVGHFRSELISSLTIVFMYLASIHFGLIFMTLVNRSLRPLKNPVLRFYTVGLILCSVVSSISLKMEGVDATWARAFLDGTFHASSHSSSLGSVASARAMATRCC